MNLSESLRAARRLKEKTGVEIAEALNMTSAAYLRYERGEVTPSAKTILELSDILNLSPNALMLTGGVEESGTTRTQVSSLDLDLQAGDRLTIELTATVKNDLTASTEQKPYTPNVRGRRKRSQNIKKSA